MEEGTKRKVSGSRLSFIVFIVLAVGLVVFGIYSLIMNMNAETYNFSQNGYAVVLEGDDDNSIITYDFASGDEYSYKKYEDAVSFDSVKIADTAMIHYSDGSLLALKNMVGMDLSTIDKEIIPYYNIFKNTHINYENGVYSIATANGEKQTFENLLLRIDDQKYLLASDNIRMSVDDTIISYGDYAYFEYSAGSVVKVYDSEEFYQTISSSASIVSDDIAISLGDETIKKAGIGYLSLTNLVMNQDSNIDLIADDTEGKEDEAGGIMGGDVDVGDGGTAGGGSTGGVGGITDGTASGDGTTGGGTQQQETVVDEENVSEIKYRVTKLDLTALKADIVIRIEDEDNLLTSGTKVKVIENATYSTKCELDSHLGDVKIEMSCLNLSPDTEYTLYASAAYRIEDIDYEKTFISKIFRTEALGIEMQEEYVTTNSAVFSVNQEKYSKITSAKVTLYAEDGIEVVDEESVSFTETEKNVEVVFEDLESSTNYIAKISDFLSQGVIVDDGFSMTEETTTLSEAPTISDLSFEIDKKNSVFNLNVGTVVDNAKGIVGYEFLIYDARYNMNESDPIMVVATDKTNTTIQIDDVKIFKNVAYTYRVKTIFYDGEKYIEYLSDLNRTMQLEGVEFPTVRWEGSYITWEQINGTIIVDDSYNAVVGNEFTIIYKNSVDIHTTITLSADAATGNIPVAINNLRKNETYTFQVYANINLQDGNPTIDNAYLGSVYVQTDSPNALSVSYEDMQNFSRVFDFKVQLGNPSEEIDSSLEAATLTGVTFTLYEGTDAASGAKAAVRRMEDANEKPYESSLKTLLYDEQQEITADFFNMSEGDFTQKNYTLVISYAYDYTVFPNELPLLNTTYTFATNLFIPDYGDPNDAINVTPVLNAAATKNGLAYNQELDATTIVGYNISAKFDNSSQLGRYVVYHVWRKETDGTYKELEDLKRTVYFDNSGNLPSALFEVGAGTEYDVNDDDMLRRGNTYKFSYEAYLDLGGDDLILYPHIINPDVILYSTEKKTTKQSPSFALYPSDSTDGNMIWKYKYSDYDKTIADDIRYLTIFVGTVKNPITTVEIEAPDNSFHAVDFGPLSVGAYGIAYTARTLKGISEVTALSMQYMPSSSVIADMNFSTDTVDGQVVISIADAMEHSEDLNRVSSADVTLTPLYNDSVEPKTISNLMIDNGNIRIDYYDIVEFLSVDFSTSVTVRYDTNIIGYDVETGDGMGILQTMSIEGMQEYLCVLGNAKKLSRQSNAYGCNANIGLSLPTSDNDETAIIYNNGIGNSMRFISSIDQSGVAVSNTFYGVVKKKMNNKTLSYIPDEVNSARFDEIVPGISMLNTSNKIDIIPLINSAVINPKVKYLDPSLVENGLVYYEIMITDVNGANGQPYRDGSILAEEFGSSWTVNNLVPDSNYVIKFYVYLWNGTEYRKQYMYDVDFGFSGYSYRFYTMSDVGIDKIKLELLSESYTSRVLKLSYTLKLTTGFDYIDYEIYHLVDGEYVKTNILYPRVTSFSTSMSSTYNVIASENVEVWWGETYKVVINPVGSYTDENGVHVVDLGKKEAIITLANYTEPYLGFSVGKNVNGDGIYWRVSIKDPDHIIYNDTYSFKVVDNESFNVIYTANNVSTNVLNRLFSINQSSFGLVLDRGYTGVLSVGYDRTNTGLDLSYENISKAVVFGDQIDVGSISINKSSGNLLDFVFANSYHLDKITSISYGITRASTGDLVDSVTNAEFVLNYVTEGDFYYFRTLVNDPYELFVPNEVYLISMSFYKDNRLIDQSEASYYYGE